MQVYHGTNRKALRSIEQEGIDAPSYWTDSLEKAQEYADSWGAADAVVLSCETNDHDFVANMAVAQCLFDSDEIETMPDPSDLAHSLEFLEGIVCSERIVNYVVVSSPEASLTSRRRQPR